MSHPTSTPLREGLHPLIRQLADNIETLWHEQLDLSPYTIPEDLGYIENTLEGETLRIQNICYQTPQFRKIHLELAQVGKNLDILHCVMFPRLSYPLPMFGADIVAGRGQISAAIVDLSPIPAHQPLPESYQQGLAEFSTTPFSEPRALPAWGDIFSPFCTFVHPVNPQENELFLAKVCHYLKLHCQIASTTQPTSLHEELQTILQGQVYYCTRQRQNDKTRRVLEKAFGADWAERYMSTMLFDDVQPAIASRLAAVEALIEA